MKLRLTLLVALAACAGADEGALVPVEIGSQNPDVTPDEPPHDVEFNRHGLPYFEPVSQETDELMNLVEDNPDLFPDSSPLPLISQIIHPLIAEKAAALREGRPMEVMKWHSALYHGTTFNGTPCYALGSDKIPCYFPIQKNQLTLQGGGSGKPFKCSAVSLAAGDINVLKMPKNLADIYMDGVLRGMTLQERTSIPMKVRASMPAGTLADPNILYCNAAQPAGKLATTRVFTAQFPSCQAGLPKHGVIDPTCAEQTTDVETEFYPARMYAQLIQSCGFTATQLATNTTTIDGYAQFVGVHEFLHSIGFGHFTTGVMKPSFACSAHVESINQVTALMSQPFVDAMTIYSGGHENDDGILHDTGLGGPNIGPVQNNVSSEDTTVLPH